MGQDSAIVSFCYKMPLLNNEFDLTSLEGNVIKFDPVSFFPAKFYEQKFVTEI